MIIPVKKGKRRRKTRDKCYAFGGTCCFCASGESLGGCDSSTQIAAMTTQLTTVTLTTMATKSLPFGNRMQNLRENSGFRQNVCIAKQSLNTKSLRRSSMINELYLYRRQLPLMLLLLLLSTFCWFTCVQSAAHKHHHRLSLYNNKTLLKIPGLYETSVLLTPVQGNSNFDELVLGQLNDKEQLDNGTLPILRKDRTYVNLVQYYMATCPDCQGFSPYFKRLVSDIGGHWHNLVRLLTVNCNDDLNINLCWQQNPTLIVPLIRWYAFPDIQLDSRQSTPGNLFAFPNYLLNVAHRNFIEKQRRDLISLRRATLRYLNSILDQLKCNGPPEVCTNRLECSNCTAASTNFYTSLPTRWHLLSEIGARRKSDSNATTFVEDLKWRVNQCLKESGRENSIRGIENYIVFEQLKSFAGRTLIADWSNWTCSSQQLPSTAKRLLLIHYVTDFNLLDQVKHIQSTSEDSKQQHLNSTSLAPLQPLLFSFNISTKSGIDIDIRNLQLKLISSNVTLVNNSSKSSESSSSASTTHRPKRHVAEEASPKLARRSQRVTLEQYSTRRRSLDSVHRLSFRYATSMTTTDRQKPPARIRRSTKKDNGKASSKSRVNQLEAENINWAPVELYPNEEALRYEFNKRVAEFVFGTKGNNNNHTFAGYPNGNQGELVIPKPNGTAVVSAYDEDTAYMRLTDYYRVLADVVHKNILYKAEFDGFQYLASTCFLKTLAQHFPFQGSAGEQKSISRNFIELLQRQQLDELHSRIHKLSANCRNRLELNDETRSEMQKLRIPRDHLEAMQTSIRTKHDVDLPAAGHFKWSYCAGSSEYLRGYTCSLWVLFHTITVHEYLKVSNATTTEELDSNGDSRDGLDSNNTAEEDDKNEEYKFTIEYLPNNTYCDPKNPEPALLNSTSEQLFATSNNYALANIINFVRYYLPCANCAAHFSCMVNNSRIDFDKPKPDDHLLWLWEGHNRVNLRTKNTHSEDPQHPKHVFPVYEACPECYLKKPDSNSTSFTDMRFNRKQLVNFIVARYRRSAILNNKIRIEDLFRKPVDTSGTTSRPD